MRNKTQTAADNWWETTNGAGTATEYCLPGRGKPNVRLYSNMADQTWILDSRRSRAAKWRELARGEWPAPSVEQATEMRLAAVRCLPKV